MNEFYEILDRFNVTIMRFTKLNYFTILFNNTYEYNTPFIDDLLPFKFRTDDLFRIDIYLSSFEHTSILLSVDGYVKKIDDSRNERWLNENTTFLK